jgi:hypothetical protein
MPPGGVHALPGTLGGEKADRPKDRIRLEHPIPYLLGGIEAERLKLSEREETGDMIDIGVGEEDGLDRGAAGSAVRMEAIE